MECYLLGTITSTLLKVQIHEITRMPKGEFMYRRLNNLLPDNIFDHYIKPVSHSYNTRSKANKELYTGRTNTNYGKFDIKYSAAKVWNDIPLGIRNSSSLAIFKKQFKNYILSQFLLQYHSVYVDTLHEIKWIMHALFCLQFAHRRHFSCFHTKYVDLSLVHINKCKVQELVNPSWVLFLHLPHCVILSIFSI